ncbi:putative winged helix-turn-helix DNA-binding domain-containing protein [Rosa chinensis]|uniref:Putative winged helix-turn-helix DNA-binding domain-containing protein n=1 Tax=Rosa chinensis TaxID=74649 RepID=A0A2P6RHY0_ROSCH|nr:putative winged helix-turn-helix DNA-binding domain-containing protein [Rosa chinensis]
MVNNLGVSRALVENSRTLLLPAHLHERLGLIKNAKVRFEDKRITPSIDRIAESLNMSKKKVRKLLRTNHSVKHKPHLHHDKSTHSTGAII